MSSETAKVAVETARPNTVRKPQWPPNLRRRGQLVVTSGARDPTYCEPMKTVTGEGANRSRKLFRSDDSATTWSRIAGQLRLGATATGATVGAAEA